MEAKLVAGDGNAPSSTSAYETERYLLQPAINLVDRERIELSISGCKPDVFPLALTAQIILKHTTRIYFKINWSRHRDSNSESLGKSQI